MTGQGPARSFLLRFVPPGLEKTLSGCELYVCFNKKYAHLGLLRNRDVDVLQLPFQATRWNGDAKARVHLNVKLYIQISDPPRRSHTFTYRSQHRIRLIRGYPKKTRASVTATPRKEIIRT